MIVPLELQRFMEVEMIVRPNSSETIPGSGGTWVPGNNGRKGDQYEYEKESSSSGTRREMHG